MPCCGRVEQGQILTTHNLAVLVDVLGLRERITALAPELAERALDWVVRRMAVRPDSTHAALIAVKNSAYAWRQAVFFLSFCDQSTQESLAERLDTRRLGQAVAGPRHVIGGGRFNADGVADEGRRFLGWSAGPHWALDYLRL